ncbi:NHLP leader peptide family RiPP precursor [Falsiroseomonas sp.]|uniref:NHLP leader peptide family RiPP precursor n=1 Tax=Falsiroseomonas sp. TaxID=2870721 RepID=UPI003F716548
MSISFEELPQKIAARAANNPEFRAEFMADPKAAFAKYTDLTLPPELEIKVHEQKPGQLHFVLPPVVPTGKLSDEDLERVAGGVEIGFTIASAIISGISLSVTAVSAANDAEDFW